MNIQKISLLLLGLFICSQAKIDFPEVNLEDFQFKLATVSLDHFNPQETRTFQLRYWVDEQYFSLMSGPVFLYICGEWTCSPPSNRKYPIQVAAKLNALVIVLEHRYYGDSQPFRDDQGGWSTSNLQWLTSEQALADMAQFIEQINVYLLTQYRIQKRQWIICGGSYAGALSAWFRSQYPNHVLISWSSSGVINAIEDFTNYDLNNYNATKLSGDFCPETIQAINQYIDDVFTSAQQGQRLAEYQQIQTLFGSQDLTDAEFTNYIADTFAGQVQYGQRTSLCNFMSGIQSLSSYDQLVQVKSYADSLGMDVSEYTYKYLLNTTVDMNKASRQWSYQYCREFGWFQTPDPTTPLRSSLIKQQFWLDECALIFPELQSSQFVQISATNSVYKGLNIEGSNIYFANSVEDPWQWASLRQIHNYQTQYNMKTNVINCQNCAHCSDIGTPTPNDPPELTTAREDIYQTIIGWLAARSTLDEEMESAQELFLQ